MTLQLLANIDVDNLTHAIEFYCSALDLRVGRRFGQTGVELIGASSPIYLLQKAPGTPASLSSSQRRDYSRHWTPVHLDFVVPQIDPILARAEMAGARLEGEVETHVWGRIAVLADPFGHGFCLIEFLGRGYDEIAS
ncbi:MAG TPA: VOC family protein [Steroidobacteraceae bacterium]|nr:VOC family protein [Steroidobacteraceae bacterium]